MRLSDGCVSGVVRPISPSAAPLAIIPEAIDANPSKTIAALAERNIAQIVEADAH